MPTWLDYNQNMATRYGSLPPCAERRACAKCRFPFIYLEYRIRRSLSHLVIFLTSLLYGGVFFYTTRRKYTGNKGVHGTHAEGATVRGYVAKSCKVSGRKSKS